ncbi:hypothetical protein [Mesorhizobium sp. CN2-181]|uniref:hypothetical protein n=1 Tax=Mesorhizobium yinganensis TaxID=3157707 RepID=UPI0032B7A00F
MSSGYVPLEHFQQTDNDQSSDVIRDIPYGMRREFLTLYPDTLTFAPQQINSISTVQTILLKNSGYDAVSIEAVTVVGDFSNQSAALTKILAGETLALQVSFNPKRAGAATGGLHIKALNAAGHKFIPLSGSGVLAADTPTQYELTVPDDGTGDAVEIASGVYAFTGSGTFSGATLQLQWRANVSDSWISIPGAALTAADTIYGIPLNSGQARILVSGATGAVSVDSSLVW